LSEFEFENGIEIGIMFGIGIVFGITTRKC